MNIFLLIFTIAVVIIFGCLCNVDYICIGIKEQNEGNGAVPFFFCNQL
jgi:hypothetical protein